MKVHFDRAGDIVFTPMEPLAELHSKVAQPKASSLTAENLSYRYSNSDPMVFSAVSLQANAGETIALVGPSGCGKTTLLCVMGGIFLPTGGTLAYDTERVTQANATSLRRRVAFVFQNDELFEGSIEDNIAFFEPQPDRERVQRCAELAAIAADIAVYPQGYKTRLAEQGAGLSGGQRQRMLIARALYRQPSLLVLDEATSHLDVTTEKLVLHNLKTLGITIIMSAHRPDAIAMADRIYSVELKTWVQMQVQVQMPTPVLTQG
jgi:ATP-binding cassette, subfamily B, bacterial CvaB/MchF/RaxB